MTINIPILNMSLEEADKLIEINSQLESRMQAGEFDQIDLLRSCRVARMVANSGSSIKFMEAQAMLNISEGIKNGKVQTIVVPSNFTALMMNK